MEPDTLRAFLRTLQEQHQCYEQLCALNRRQRGWDPESDLGLLFELLGAKQQVMEQLDLVERQMAPLRDEWRTHRARLGEETRAKIDDLLGRVEALLRELIGLEDQNRAALDGLRASRRAELRRLERGRRVYQAYGPPRGPRDPRFLDTEN